MKDVMGGKGSSCVVTYRFELVGIILIILATILTIATLYGLGIIMLFLVGLILCCHKHVSGFGCHCHCHCPKDAACCHYPSGSDMEACSTDSPKTAKTVSKTAKKSAAD